MNIPFPSSSSSTRLDRLAALWNAGQTTPDEEQELRRLLAADADVRYDDLRAALAYVAEARRRAALAARPAPVAPRPAKKRRLPIMQRVAAAACFATLAIGALWMVERQHSAATGGCVAWVNGQKVEDSERVIDLMAESLENVGLNEQRESVVETKMQDLLDGWRRPCPARHAFLTPLFLPLSFLYKIHQAKGLLSHS